MVNSIQNADVLSTYSCTVSILNFTIFYFLFCIVVVAAVRQSGSQSVSRTHVSNVSVQSPSVREPTNEQFNEQTTTTTTDDDDDDKQQRPRTTIDADDRSTKSAGGDNGDGVWRERVRGYGWCWCVLLW